MRREHFVEIVVRSSLRHYGEDATSAIHAFKAYLTAYPSTYETVVELATGERIA